MSYGKDPKTQILTIRELFIWKGQSAVRKPLGDKALSSPPEAGCLGRFWRANPGHFLASAEAPKESQEID